MKKFFAISGLLFISLSSFAQSNSKGIIQNFSGLCTSNSIEVIWKSLNNTPIRVLYSPDNGRSWKVLSNNAKSPFKIEKVKKFNHVKLETIDKKVSSTLTFEIKPKGFVIGDLSGNKMFYVED